jgi:hypothetical protein
VIFLPVQLFAPVLDDACARRGNRPSRPVGVPDVERQTRRCAMRAQRVAAVTSPVQRSSARSPAAPRCDRLRAGIADAIGRTAPRRPVARASASRRRSGNAPVVLAAPTSTPARAGRPHRPGRSGGAVAGNNGWAGE